MELTDKDIARFFSRLAAPDENGCRIWTRYIAPTGYGNINIGGTIYLTHRVAYVIAHGSIPNGLFIDHVCRVRACSEATHLDAVTHQVNMQRAMPFRTVLTHCHRGHALTEDNVRRYNGSRFCIECDRIRGRAYYQRQKELRESAE